MSCFKDLLMVFDAFGDYSYLLHMVFFSVALMDEWRVWVLIFQRTEIRSP